MPPRPGYGTGGSHGRPGLSLRTIPGLGPFYAGLVLLRASGVSDALILDEPRLRSYVRHYYGLPDEPDDAAVRRIAERWRPFRTWAAVLIRASGESEGLPWRQAGPAGQAGPARPARPARR